MRRDNKGLTLIGVAVVLLIGVAAVLLIGGVLLDPADDNALVEINDKTLEVARFDAVDLEASGGITNAATVSFTDENGNSYLAVTEGASVTVGRGLMIERALGRGSHPAIATPDHHP